MGDRGSKHNMSWRAWPRLQDCCQLFGRLQVSTPSKAVVQVAGDIAKLVLLGCMAL
jgi:hypothetical protein